MTASPRSTEIDAETEGVSVEFRPSRSHDGGRRSGTLVLEAADAETTIPVEVRVVPLSFWERYGDAISAILIGLVLLALLVFVVYGFLSPHEFPAHLRFHWGEEIERLDKNEMILREVQGTGSGFYQNTSFVIGGRGSSLSVGGTRLCVLEATGKNEVTLRAGPDVELARVNKFDPDEEAEVEGGETPMIAGDIYCAGELYVRIR